MDNIHIYFDASVEFKGSKTSTAAAGYSIYDDSENLIGWGQIPLSNYFETTTAEFSGLIHALFHALNIEKDSNIIIKGDSESVIRLADDSKHTDARKDHIKYLKNITQSLLLNFNHVLFMKIDRQKNKAHTTAREALNKDSPIFRNVLQVNEYRR